MSRLRVVPWQGDPYTALVGPRPAGRPPSVADVVDCLAYLTEIGVNSAVTPALAGRDAEPFSAAGFSLRERLHLLAYLLDAAPTAPQQVLKPGRPWHRDAVVNIDREAFEPFWQFDRAALSEARKATPSHRFRIAQQDGELVGYAVTGKAGNRGYLQRLAVSPKMQGSGLGSALVHDSLQWLHRRGVRIAMVNTQERNERAFKLYKHLGFRPQSEGLTVLGWTAPQ